MARLVVNPGSPVAWEIQLKPGTNLLGRGFSNDFKIADPSVSGSHCQITINGHSAVIKDLGSTNGTYVNRAPVQEATLQAGQTVHLGGVEMVFYSDAPAVTVTGAPPLPPPVAVPAAGEPPVAPGMTVTGTQNCKFHPKTPGRYFCPKCQLYFCEFCITTRQTGEVQHKMCRKCGTECTPVHVKAANRADQAGFFSRLPGVFIYPAKGAGIFVLIVCSIVIGALGFLGGGITSIFVGVAFLGYLFSFMQNIIHSTTAGDEEMPGWPAFDDLGGCFIRLVGAAIISFGVPITFGIMAFFSEESTIGSTLMLPALAFGCFYFPMALLAVAMKDTPLAANPLVVLPAIAKVPGEYIITVILMAAVLTMSHLGGPMIAAIFPRGLLSHSIPKMCGFLAASALWHFVSVYLLAVNMRILGILYLSRKHKFGWFSH